MFGKLKEKLKESLSLFSRKAEKEAKEVPVEIEKAETRKEEAKKEEKKEAVKEKVKVPDVKTPVARKTAQEPKKAPEKREIVPPDQVKITYFVHGTTTDNEQDLATGWNPGNLSRIGEKQSIELWEKVKEKQFEIVFCSDLKRAIDSAELTFGSKVKILQDKRLRECNYGAFTGQAASLFKSKLEEYVYQPFPSGESYLDVEKRITEFLNYVYDHYLGKHIAIVAHQAPQLALEVVLNGKSWEQAIKEDWRLKKAWQPGWEYVIKNRIEQEETPKIDIINIKEEKGFFGKLKEKLRKRDEEVPYKEKLNVLDEEGNRIGEESREKIHQEGLLHGEVHVLIFNEEGEILFQRRGPNQETFPRLLDASVGGHVNIGEEFLEAAIRELKEETGIGAEKKELIYLGNFQKKSLDFVTKKINNAFKKVYAFHFQGDKKDLKLETGKATSLEFWPIEKLFSLSKKEEKEFVSTLLSEKYLSFYKKIKDLVKKEQSAQENAGAKEEPIKEEKKEEPAKEKKEWSVTEEPLQEAKEEVPERGFFSRVKEKFTTKIISAEKFEELFWELEIALLENNVSVEVIEKIKEDLQEELVEKPLPRDVEKKIEETLKKTLDKILSLDGVDLLERIREKTKGNRPFIIAFFGINGSGKTTSIAKLAHYLKKHGQSVVLAACDTFRAAAIQQLGEHADKLGVKMIKQDYGSDSAAVAFDAVKYAEKNKISVVLIDTAGRLHSNTNLMEELKKIIRVTKPDFNLFVGESITGNDCIEQARQFNSLVSLDGIMLTKADVDEKGGAPLSIAYTIKKPILFLGTGQGYENLEKFDKEVILERLGL